MILSSKKIKQSKTSGPTLKRIQGKSVGQTRKNSKTQGKSGRAKRKPCNLHQKKESRCRGRNQLLARVQ